MLHECCVPTALHAAWPARGTRMFYVHTFSAVCTVVHNIFLCAVSPMSPPEGARLCYKVNCFPVEFRPSSSLVSEHHHIVRHVMHNVFVCVGPQAFLSIEDDTEQPEESVFCQVQSLFGHLMESKLQYYVPENFWKVIDHTLITPKCDCGSFKSPMHGSGFGFHCRLKCNSSHCHSM